MANKLVKAIRNPGAVPSFLSYQLAQRLFHIPNPGGTSAVLKGNANLFKNRLLSDYSAPDSPEIDELRKEHLLQLGYPFDEADVRAIKNHYDEMITEDRFIQDFSGNRSPPPGYEDEVFTRRIWGYGDHGDAQVNFFEEFPEISNLISDVGDLVSGYFGSYFNVGKITAYRTYHVPAEVVQQTELYSNYWHCDPHSIDSIKLFVLLDDVDENTGPFNYVNRADTQQLAKGFNRKQEGVPGRAVEQRATPKTFTGETGRALLFNTNRLLHRAGNPAPNSPRDMLLIQFVPSAKETSPEDWERRSMEGVKSL